MEYRLERQHLCTHITAIKAIGNDLFVAESNHILLYDWKKKVLLEREVVFQSCSVHGIRTDASKKVLFFGGKSARIYTYDFSSMKRLLSITDEFYLNDWIYDIKWLNANKLSSNSFIAISAHNCLSIWNIDKTQTNVFQSTEHCILYAGCIICSNSELIIVAAGTVFKEIILWSPNSVSDSSGRKPSIHNLTGHQGVIFSISYNKHYKLLSSTSDDRSVRLWKIHNNSALNDDSLEFWEKADIQITLVLFAHESRVWMSAILDNCILSVGEDSQICFWDLNGMLLKKKKVHKGGSIWCLETTCTFSKIGGKEIKNYIAFTGGSDGGVYMWDVESAIVSRLISQITLPSKETTTTDFPRITFLLTNKLAKHLMVTTDKGWLSLYNIKLQSWEDIFYDSAFASYCVPSVSNGSRYLALGSISGELALLSLEDYSTRKCKIKKVKAHDNKICSLHWVNEASDYLLTCSIKGHMVFWKISYENKEFNIKSIQELFLPKCKHHWWSTAALYINSQDCIIVGDRSGSVSMYSKLHNNSNPKSEDNKLNPCMSHRYIHGDNGVTDIQQYKMLIYSAGRDGKVQLYALHDSNLNLLHTIKVSHDLEWIGRMLFYGKDLLLLGFHTKDFMVWSTQLESAIMTVECGGGHRSWDFCLSEDGTATFAAIKKKDVIFSTENLQHSLNISFLKNGIAGQEFCCTSYLFTKNFSTLGSISVVACGGEDNALRIIGFINEGQEHEILPLCSLSGHLSSIKAINNFKLFEENAYLVISVGGRSQMMLWKITNDTNVQGQQLGSYILSGLCKTTNYSKKDNRNIQFDPQTRLMDVAICKPEKSSFGTYIISAACSDSFFRVYTFNINTRKLSLCFNVHHGEHCILRLSQIFFTSASSKNNFFITGATNGYIKIFHLNTCNYMNSTSNLEGNILLQAVVPDLQLKSHQSGINALDAKYITDADWLIGTAGDDNALSISVVHFELLGSEHIKCIELSRAQVKSAHASQITGLKIFNGNTIVTASIDQRINIWTWKSVEGDLVIDLSISKISLIPDIAHLEAWQNEVTKSWTLLVCGQGIESFTFALNEENKSSLKT